MIKSAKDLARMQAVTRDISRQLLAMQNEMFRQLMSESQIKILSEESRAFRKRRSEYLSRIILLGFYAFLGGGILDRFPRLKVAFLEAGVDCDRTHGSLFSL